MHSSGFDTSQLGLHVGQGERRPTRCERNQREAAELLGAVALVVVDMAFLLHQDAASVAGETPERQVVGERPGRQIDRHVLAEQRRKARLEACDHAVARIFVGLYSGVVRKPAQQAGVIGGRQREAIGAQLHGAILHDNVDRLGRPSLHRADKSRQGTADEKLTTRNGQHGVHPSAIRGRPSPLTDFAAQ
jgi:hypothetical protein